MSSQVKPDEIVSLGQRTGPHTDELKAHAEKLSKAAADIKDAVLQVEHSAEQEDQAIADAAIKDAHLASGRALASLARISKSLVSAHDQLD